MSLNLRLERLYDRIELVNGIGNPERGQLCTMSLVAYLAGEAHGDAPRTASALIRDYVVLLNDRMDRPTRQKLKPFAPRIIGTNDGRDDARAALLYRAMIEEVFPRVIRDLKHVLYVSPQGRERRSPASAPAPERLLALLTAAEARDLHPVDARRIKAMKRIVKAHRRREHGPMAKAAARLVTASAENAPGRRRRAWYTAKGIELIDRLCDVGAETRSPVQSGAGLRDDRVARLAAPPERRDGGGRAACLREAGASLRRRQAETAGKKGVVAPILARIGTWVRI